MFNQAPDDDIEGDEKKTQKCHHSKQTLEKTLKN